MDHHDVREDNAIHYSTFRKLGSASYCFIVPLMLTSSYSPMCIKKNRKNWGIESSFTLKMSLIMIKIIFQTDFQIKLRVILVYLPMYH